MDFNSGNVKIVKILLIPPIYALKNSIMLDYWYNKVYAIYNI